MISPKDKAEELVNQYRILFMNNGGDYVDELLVSMLSKQCALVAVDEIIEATTKIVDGGEGWQLVESNPYWQEVKQEIESL
jgi:hypothetical protein